MKAVRADFIENLENESEDASGLLFDELTKAFLLFPKASNDIFGTQALSAEDLAHKAQGTTDPKVINRLTKLMLLVNKRDEEGNFEANKEMENYSMRNLFSRNASYFDTQQANIGAISDMLSECLKFPDSSQSIVQNVYDYANFAGGGSKEKKNKTLLVFVFLGLAGIAGYIYYKSTYATASN